LGKTWRCEVASRILTSVYSDTGRLRAARTVMECVASVEKVSVNVNGLEREYVDGVDSDAVTVPCRFA
jgi:hypothetical protein